MFSRRPSSRRGSRRAASSRGAGGVLRGALQCRSGAGVLSAGLAPGLLLGKAYHVEIAGESAEEIFEDLYRKYPRRQREIALWYDRPPDPPVSEEDTEWARSVVDRK